MINKEGPVLNSVPVRYVQLRSNNLVKIVNPYILPTIMG